MSKSIFSALEPLPLPPNYRRQAFRFGKLSQLSVAFMINLLSLAIPIMMLQVYDRVIPHQSYGTLTMLTAGVMTAVALDAMLRLLRAWLTGLSAASQEHLAGMAAVSRLSRADILEYESETTTKHLQGFTAISRLREIYNGQALAALVDLPFAALFIALIAYMGGYLALVPVALLALFVVSAVMTGVRLRKALRARLKADDHKMATAVSLLSGIQTIKILGAENFMLRRFEERQAEVTNESARVARAGAAAANLGAIFAQLSLILTATFGCILVAHGHLTVGGLSACTLLASRVIQPVQRVLSAWLRLQDLSLARSQAGDLLSFQIQDRDKNKPPPATGAVEINEISFAYRPGAQILSNVSLSVTPGSVIAVGGENSSGKSTLLQVIAGILQPYAGTVRTAGVDPFHYGLGALWRHIGYLPQQGAIFRGTIMDNLTGFRDDQIIIARARRMAEELGLNGVIDRLPLGYRTMLMDTPSDALPPGIKQRIALARIFLNDPQVILFDDADHSLDKEGYNRLFRLLGRLKGRRTMIIASVDQNLLSLADQIYRLENGALISTALPRRANLSYLLPSEN